MSASSRKTIFAQENDSPNRAAVAEPQLVPPKPPRSAFMCFTETKKKEILIAAGNAKEKEELLKTVAAEWRLLTDRDRAYWDEIARNDKVRFVREKSEYKGPWNVPKRRAKKHPLAPKRPMSAFLKYSQKRRSMVKEKNPDMSNTDVSRLLGEMWRSASPSERAPYVEQEEVERANYKEVTKSWREEQAQLDAASRTSHHSVQHGVEKQPPPPTTTTQRREYDYGSYLESAHAPLRVPSVEGAVDRRIFRSYSGTARPLEKKPYKADHHRAFRPSYPNAEIAHANTINSDAHQFRPHKAADIRSYKHATMESGSAVSPKMMQHPSRHPPQAYRAPNMQHQIENNHHQAPLRNTGSDISQFDAFYDPEPPFNPRQSRPSSSHYFPDSFYQYP